MLSVNNLKKSYKSFQALKGISYEVKDGEVFGILGPNGAGKSTMIKILTCFNKPSSGSVKVQGIPIKKVRKVKKLIGWVPQEDTFYPGLTVEENLVYFGSLYGIKGKKLRLKMAELLKLLGLMGKKEAIAGSLSGGMKRRLSVAIALIHDPKILLLDEPTAGVDPLSRRDLWNVIRLIKKKGMTILFCTHYLDEADLLCDRIAILKEGKIVASGTSSQLKKKYGHTLEDVFLKVVRQK